MSPVTLSRRGSRPAALALCLISVSLAPAAFGDLRELDTSALRSINARGLAASLYPQPDDGDAPLEWLRLFNPLLTLMDADVRIRGLRPPRTIHHVDGTLELQLTGPIEEIRFDNLRVRGAPLEQRFGSLRFENVDFSGSSLRIRGLP
ncbi:MAG TPA: hypothetical protein VL178_06050 [Pseudomonas sp.]|jgi:hypothetical protein|nr:hypothetical protein [Pseudomonas sp.]